MKKVQRSEIVDYLTYIDTRDAFRQDVLKAKEVRRIHLGPNLTFLFENPLTVRYQVQEMTRVEQLVREADINHELATYNELLGGPGELGCTLLIAFETEAERAEKLVVLKDLNPHLFVETASGARIAATYDARQVGEDRLSSVQYLKFDTKGEAPVAMLSTHPQYAERTEVTPPERAALEADLASDRPTT